MHRPSPAWRNQSRVLDDRALRQRFLQEIRRQKVPFGIRILEASSGETATEAYNFQAFLGEINLASKVYPDGREDYLKNNVKPGATSSIV